MNNIETAVGENHFFTVCTSIFNRHHQLINGHYATFGAMFTLYGAA